MLSLDVLLFEQTGEMENFCVYIAFLESMCLSDKGFLKWSVQVQGFPICVPKDPSVPYRDIH